MRITHRIPWPQAYAYTEVEYDTAVEGELSDNDYETALNHAIAMSLAAQRAGFGPEHHPMVAEVIAHGGVPELPAAAPQRQQQHQPQRQQQRRSGTECRGCGGPTTTDGKIRENDYGRYRIHRCAGDCVSDDGRTLSTFENL